MSNDFVGWGYRGVRLPDLKGTGRLHEIVVLNLKVGSGKPPVMHRRVGPVGTGTYSGKSVGGVK
jgi:hypothetical protein